MTKLVRHDARGEAQRMFGTLSPRPGFGVSIGPLEPGFYSVGAGLATASALSVSTMLHMIGDYSKPSWDPRFRRTLQ